MAVETVAVNKLSPQKGQCAVVRGGGVEGVPSCENLPTTPGVSEVRPFHPSNEVVRFGLRVSCAEIHASGRGADVVRVIRLQADACVKGALSVRLGVRWLG